MPKDNVSASEVGQSGDEEWSFFAGMIGDDPLEIPESQYDYYEKLAADEGMSFDEFVESLADCAPLFMALSTVNGYFQHWLSSDTLPKLEGVEAATTELVEGRSAARGPFPYEEFCSWAPSYADQVQSLLRVLERLLESAREVSALEDEVKRTDGAEHLLDDLETKQSQARDHAWELIESQHDLIEDLPLPVIDPYDDTHSDGLS